MQCLGRVWLEPTSVKTIVITRPKPAADAFWQLLDAEMPGQFTPVFAPLIEIVPVETEIHLQGVGGLIFASANAVQQFVRRWPERHFTAWCVGDATRDAAILAGFEAVSAGGNAEDLMRLMREKANPALGKFLHIHGVFSTGLSQQLSLGGFVIESVSIYDQAAKAIDPAIMDMLQTGVDVVTFFSPRTARLFAGTVLGQGWNFAGTTAVCLSGAISLESADVGFGRVFVCDRPNMASMIDQLGRLV